jgi:hypothetical protein
LEAVKELARQHIIAGTPVSNETKVERSLKLSLSTLEEQILVLQECEG